MRLISSFIVIASACILHFAEMTPNANYCVKNYLKGLGYLHAADERRDYYAYSSETCDKIIADKRSTFLKLHKAHLLQMAKTPRSKNVVCFIKKIKKFELFERHLLDSYLRNSNEQNYMLFRNNYIYNRLKDEALKMCDI